MTRFEDTIAQVFKNLVTGPIGAQDMNAGEHIVQQPDKHYGRDEDAELYREDEELDKSVVPQHYIPQYGKVEVLFKAGPPATVIKAGDQLRDDVTDREIVVGGYASPQVIDREKHLIQKEAMEKDLPRFLAVPLFANAMILHSNVQVGQVLPEWTHPDTGKTYKTAVDDIGLFCIIKIRTDKYRPKIVDKVIEDIEKGNLKAFSISGDAPLESRQHKCDGGECFWIIPAIEFYEITICEEGVNQGAKLMILSKSCSDGKCGLVLKQPVPEGELDEQPEPTPQAALPTGVLDMDAEATKEELSERVGEIASVVGEEEAAELVEDVVEASEKLDNVDAGVGATGSGDANTMADFGKPYSRDTAVMKGDPSIDRFFQAYRAFLARGASPEDAYFKLLEDGADGEPAPDWFGTRDGKFRQFLIQAYHSGLSIPTIRLRMQGNKEGEIVPDPELMAWDLLQTAVNRMRGMVDKDVSPVEHEHNKDGYDSVPSVPFSLVDPRGIPQEECNGFLEWDENNLEGVQERALNEPEESETYYLNLALKALNKSDSTLGAIAGSKIHEAYTVAMDGIYRLGHLTQEQRIDLSSAITEALDAFHKEIGDMGDLEIPADDVALLMKVGGKVEKHAEHNQSTHGNGKKARRPETVKPSEHGHHAVGFGSYNHTHPTAPRRQYGRKHPFSAIESHRNEHDGKVEKHRDRRGSTAHHTTHEQRMETPHDHKVLPGGERFSHTHGYSLRTHGHPRGVSYAKPKPAPIKKHRDKLGSTEHHKTGGAIGGIAAPPASAAPQAVEPMEDRLKVLTAEVRERNAQGANLRLSPGRRNAPYAVTGMDALQRPLRLVGSVEEITQALRENSAEVDEQRKMDNYAVPIEVGMVNEVKIYEGDGVSPMDVVREQVARASFAGAVATVLKHHTGVRGRDFLMDEKQQVEPENVSVMGGVRVPGNRNQEGHATTEIEQGGDVEGISGTKVNIATEPVEQAPPSHGIAQQGAVSPPQGVQGIGETPEFVQEHDDQPMHGARKEQEGVGLDPRSDADNRGAPVAHRTQRP